MTCRIEAGVLALAVRKVRDLPREPSAVLTGAVDVRVDRLDPDHHRTAPGRSVRQTALRNHDRAAAKLKLRAVGADAQPDLEGEGLLEPFHRSGNIGIFEDRDDRATRHGKVRPHPERLQFCVFESVRPRPFWLLLGRQRLDPKASSKTDWKALDFLGFSCPN